MFLTLNKSDFTRHPRALVYILEETGQEKLLAELLKTFGGSLESIRTGQFRVTPSREGLYLSTSSTESAKSSFLNSSNGFPQANCAVVAGFLLMMPGIEF
jgi:hypothetical protein